MKIKLNGNDFEFQLETEKKIGEVLGKIEQSCKEEKATITKVKVNEKTLTTAEIEALFERSVNDDICLELFTTTGAEIKKSIEELSSDFFQHAEKLQEIPMHIQNNEHSEVIFIVEKFAETLQQFYSLTQLLDITDIPFDKKFGEKTISQYHKEIFSVLNNMLDAIAKNDTVDISDIAEYELSPLVKDLGNGLLSLEKI